MRNPTTMLSFIQRILQPDTSRKRKRTTDHITPSEIEDLRQTIIDNEPFADSEDREKAIAEFLGQGNGNVMDGDLDPARKRVKQVGSALNGRLSTISEGCEGCDEEELNEKGGGGSGSDDEMVDVELRPQGVRRSEEGNDGMVVDRDLWMWKGRNVLQR
ncbi:hypothetical protein PMZ80_004277 [Knufia obscura]|uniref:Uncharacterized protein n=1 Tax=Knufia obscura TaxID=1635080 RepID=A0ABR0RRN0_9EURO|nr:hypothetical protein PMZ80_004277 [Knufia obscura]